MQVRLPKFKLLGLLFFLAGLLIWLSPPIATMAQSAISVQAGSFDIDPGDSVDVPILIDSGSQTIGAMTFIIRYDDSVLSVEECIVETAFSSVCNPDTSGEIKLTAIAFLGVSGEFTAGTVVFRAIGSAGESSSIDIEVDTLSNLDGDDLEADITNGSISLIDDTPATNTPEPTATNTPEPTDTPEPAATDTPEPAATDTPTPTATDTPEPAATDTPEPAATDTPTPTATDTPEPAATDTPEPAATNTPEPAPTATPTSEDVEPPAPTDAYIGRSRAASTNGHGYSRKYTRK